jgi:catechol 2,3-dioxygenase-like lactoylglutathione lyase family enzyme
MTFDHVATECNDIPATIEFYFQYFPEVEVLYQDATWAFLTVGGARIALVTPGEHPPHICFRVDTRDELQRQADMHTRPIKLHRDRSESFYFNDPSGNVLEVVWYPED